MSDPASLLLSVSNAMVSLHKHQFGRGPTRARTEWAGRDALVVFLEDALLPAEIEMVRIEEGHRVAEQRLFLQRATADTFVGVVEDLTGRTVRAFTSAVDPERAMVFEVFAFEPE